LQEENLDADILRILGGAWKDELSEERLNFEQTSSYEMHWSGRKKKSSMSKI
jgi:hypothetical protein